MIVNSDDYTTLLSYDIEDLITHENLTLQNKIKEKDKEIERLNNIIKEAIEYHDNCINNSLDLDKIDDNEKLAYKVAYGIHKRYLEILDKGE